MDHIFRTGVSGEIPGMTEYIEYGRRPGAVYVPRFRNIDSKDDGVGFKRGYGFQGGAGRSAAWPEGFGAAMKHGMRKYGPWNFSMRSEEHTSELQSLVRISYAVFCLKKKTQHTQTTQNTTNKE